MWPRSARAWTDCRSRSSSRPATPTSWSQARSWPACAARASTCWSTARPTCRRGPARCALADARRRHLEHVIGLATATQPGLSARVGPEELAWLARLDREHDDVRAALRWVIDDGDAETAIRLTWALWTFWWLRGHFAE